MAPSILKKTVVLWFFVLAACTIQLVPSYDQALVDGLDKSNTSALTLFAALENGSPSAKFGDYEERYAGLIGTFDALRQRAKNRQVPPLAKRFSSLRIVSDFCNSETDPTGCVNATPEALLRVTDVLRMMRDRHRKKDKAEDGKDGLVAEDVKLFRRDYETAMGQALTLENALKR